MILPEIPHDDADFTPDLARKIVAKYQVIIAMRNSDLAEAIRLLEALLGLEIGSSEAALAFVEWHASLVGEPRTP